MSDEQDVNHSKLVRMRITNLGCIDSGGLEIELDDIVCLVGRNNSGKSTVLRAYEAAVGMQALKPEEVNLNAGDAPPTVELWVHIPEGAENVDEKWKADEGGLRVVRSRWLWQKALEKGNVVYKPSRSTWDPSVGAYSDTEKAAGLDEVFGARLPQPFRIGSLQDPAEEHKHLLGLVLEPIKDELERLADDPGSALHAKIQDLLSEARVPVEAFRKALDDVQAQVGRSFASVFSASSVRLSVSLDGLKVDPGAALMKGSRFDVAEAHGTTGWERQGTGSQRALFWSMLEVRSELARRARRKEEHEKVVAARKKELEGLVAKAGKATGEKKKAEFETQIANKRDEFERLVAGAPAALASAVAANSLPGYMLLIDEPETALHPDAVRAAKDHLFALAAGRGWQVMLTTHHPAFIDPVADHTTIVRIHRSGHASTPSVFRADRMKFEDGEKPLLKSLLAFDMNVAEMFFANSVVIVEGDTEFAAFHAVMDSEPERYPRERRPLILRARGKWTIPILVRVLTQFKVPFAVLHDVDAPKDKNGKGSGAFAANAKIAESIDAARKAGVVAVHRVSVPEFERAHGMALPQKEKPFEARRAVMSDAAVRESVRRVLEELTHDPVAGGALGPTDGARFQELLADWVAINAAGNSLYSVS